MTEGTQPPPASELPQEIIEETKELEELNQAVDEPAEVIEHTVDIKVSEDTQKEFEAVVDAVQTAESVQEQAAAAVEEARGSSAPEDPIPAGEEFTASGASDLKENLAPFKNNIEQLREMAGESQGAAGDGEKDPDSEAGGKPDFGAGTSLAADHYSGVEMTQGEVAQDSDWNEEIEETQNESGQTDGSIPVEVEQNKRDTSQDQDIQKNYEVSESLIDSSLHQRTSVLGNANATDLKNVPLPESEDNPSPSLAQDSLGFEESEVTLAESDLPEDYVPPEEDQDGVDHHAGVNQSQFATDSAGLKMEAAADMVIPASDKLDGNEKAVEAANEKLRGAEEALREAEADLRDNESAKKPGRDSDAVKPQENQDSGADPDSSSKIKGSGNPTLQEQIKMLQGNGAIALDDVAETAKSQDSQEDEAIAEGRTKKDASSFNTPGGENLIDFSARSVGAVGLRVAGSIIPGGSVISSAFDEGTSTGGTSSGVSGGVASDMSAEQNLEFLALQQNIQQESRLYQTISNALTAAHQAESNTIQNMKGADDSGASSDGTEGTTGSDDIDYSTADIDTVVQVVMTEMIESEQENLNDILEDMKASNEAKGKIRDLITELKEQQNKSKESLREEYNSLQAGDAHLASEIPKFSYQLVEGGILVSEANLITLPPDGSQISGDLLLEGEDFDQEEFDKLEDQLTHYNQTISQINEQISVLEDLSQNWSGPEVQNWAVDFAEKQSDGTYKMITKVIPLTQVSISAYVASMKATRDQIKREATSTKNKMGEMKPGSSTTNELEDLMSARARLIDLANQEAKEQEDKAKDAQP